MSVVLKKSTSEWILDKPYEINRIHLSRTEKCHTHNFVEIVYTYRGRGRHRIDDREYLVEHGDLLIVNYHSNHTVEPIEDLCYVDLMLKPEYISESLRGTEDVFLLLQLQDFTEFNTDAVRTHAFVRLEGEDRKKVETLIEWTEEEQNRRAAGSELVRHAALRLLLGIVFRKMAEDEPRQISVNAAMLRYVEQNCAEPLRLDDLAARCHYTPEHFSRMFKRYAGMTFKDYLVSCRIKRAKRLLRDTELPIERVISECGFSNRTAFFKHFFNAVGQSPLQYRKNQK